MSKLFADREKQNDTINRLVSDVAAIAQEQRSTMKSIESFVSLENYSPEQSTTIKNTVDTWSGALQSMLSNLGLESSNMNLDAGVAALALMSNTKGFGQINPQVQGTSSPLQTFVGMEGLSDAVTQRMPGMEAYDETDNANAVAFTVAYALAAGTQNGFAEMFFPTTVVTNDNMGVRLTIRLMMVMNDFTHKTDGSLADFRKRNVIKALIDHTILQNEGNRMFPVYRAGTNDASFVDQAVIAAAPINNEGEDIITAPLKVGVTHNFMGLSSTDTILAKGTPDVTDAIDPAVHVEFVYLKVGADVLKLKVASHATSNFVMSAQENYRQQVLNFDTNGFVLNGETKTISGADPVALAALKADKIIARIAFGLNGKLNTERGSVVVHAHGVQLDSAYDADSGVQLASSDAKVTALVTLLESAEILGYDLHAYRTNTNRRLRGQLVDTTYYNQIWALPWRSPVTALKPINAPAGDDNGQIASLVSHTYVRMSNEAVTTLLNTADLLKGYVDNKVQWLHDDDLRAPELFGVARFLVEPTFKHRELDMLTAINSVQSHEQARDVAAVLVNAIRDIAYQMYQDSGFQAVVDMPVNGLQGNPKILVGTDPMTARYLIIDGENRLTGPEFDYVVQTTPDERMIGKIVIAFGYPGESQGTLNPMHFGANLMAPEMVLNVPISRGGQISKELSVMPRFRQIVNVPVMGVIDVKNLPQAATNKIVIWNTPKP